MIIVPINNSLLYVEPVYQVMLNESEIPVLKKVIVASGNTVSIGDDLKSAISNLFDDDYSVDLEIIDTEDIEALIDSVIKANNNLTDSLTANNFEMIGKDITSLQAIINQLQAARQNELEEQEKMNKQLGNENTSNVINETNTVNENVVSNANNMVNNY